MWGIWHSRSCLSRPSLCPNQQVLPLQSQRNGLLLRQWRKLATHTRSRSAHLDWRRSRPAQLGNRLSHNDTPSNTSRDWEPAHLEQSVVQSEVVELDHAFLVAHRSRARLSLHVGSARYLEWRAAPLTSASWTALSSPPAALGPTTRESVPPRRAPGVVSTVSTVAAATNRCRREGKTGHLWRLWWTLREEAWSRPRPLLGFCSLGSPGPSLRTLTPPPLQLRVDSCWPPASPVTNSSTSLTPYPLPPPPLLFPSSNLHSPHSLLLPQTPPLDPLLLPCGGRRGTGLGRKEGEGKRVASGSCTLSGRTAGELRTSCVLSHSSSNTLPSPTAPSNRASESS